MTDWHENFVRYTTGCAFRVDLSIDMIDLLAVIDTGDMGAVVNWRSKMGYGNTIPCFRALERRGLAEHNPGIPGISGPHIKRKWIYRLTPAGKKMLELLVIAELIKIPIRQD